MAPPPTSGIDTTQAGSPAWAASMPTSHGVTTKYSSADDTSIDTETRRPTIMPAAISRPLDSRPAPTIGLPPALTKPAAGICSGSWMLNRFVRIQAKNRSSAASVPSPVFNTPITAPASSATTSA